MIARFKLVHKRTILVFGESYNNETLKEITYEWAREKFHDPNLLSQLLIESSFQDMLPKLVRLEELCVVIGTAELMFELLDGNYQCALVSNSGSDSDKNDQEVYMLANEKINLDTIRFLIECFADGSMGTCSEKGKFKFSAEWEGHFVEDTSSLELINRVKQMLIQNKPLNKLLLHNTLDIIVGRIPTKCVCIYLTDLCKYPFSALGDKGKLSYDAVYKGLVAVFMDYKINKNNTLQGYVTHLLDPKIADLSEEDRFLNFIPDIKFMDLLIQNVKNHM